MRFTALASDYDGTLAQDGAVTPQTLDALERLRHSGRKLILVTGRELPDLQNVFPAIDRFDMVVAENGAVLFNPSTREKRVLAAPPKASFIEALRSRGVQPISLGDVIVATWEPHETTVLEVIRDLGLELQVIFNKGAVMILPAGVNKMSGLRSALEQMCLSRHNVVGVGDAENDHAFLQYCEFSVAVANALPAVKETADLVTGADHGAGVVELIEKLLADDPIVASAGLGKRAIPIGSSEGHEVSIPPYGTRILIAGASGSGKSTFATGLIEAFMDRDHQICLIDPEGDYASFPGVITIGAEDQAPSIDQVLQALQDPSVNVNVNFVGLAMADRPAFFASLLPRLHDMRTRTGRPHWLVIDEAHHMLPSGLAPAMAELAGELTNPILITIHPDHVAAAALKAINVVVGIGPAADSVLQGFADASGARIPPVQSPPPGSGEGLVWFRDSGEVRLVFLVASNAERKRHKRKYSHGELAEDLSFYFRGPDSKLNLRAQNLMIFAQLADGIDDDTWVFHLKNGEYSQWFRDVIKDEGLASEAVAIENDRSLSPAESRRKIREAVESRYTAPA